MGKKSGPPAPDYTGAAQAQAAASQEQTTQQTWANRPNMTTPWGSQTWSSRQVIDPSTNRPVTEWSSNIELSPEQQQALSSQLRIQQGRSDAAEMLLGQATGAFQQPMAWDSLPSGGQRMNAMTGDLSTSPTNRSGPGYAGSFSFGADQGNIQRDLSSDPSAVRQTAQDAVWKLQKPMLDDQRSDLENQLSNQGIARGSEAWNREMMRSDDAMARAQLQAIEAGRGEAGQLFNQDLQRGQFVNSAQAQDFGQDITNSQLNNQTIGQRFGLDLSGMNFENTADQQAFSNAMQLANQQFGQTLQANNYNDSMRQRALAEMLQRRGQPLNELNALLTGQQVNMPSMPGFSQAGRAETPDLLGAAQMQYQSGLDAYNARMGSFNNMLSGATQLGVAAMPFMFSDERLKDDIVRVGETPAGIGIYSYRFLGSAFREIGVLAQEVLKKIPEAVATDSNTGFYVVNYAKIR